MDRRTSPGLLRNRRFRFNPAFRAVEIGRLTPDERRDLGDVRNDGDVAVVLLPTVPALSAKAVCADTARLLESLRNPCELSPETCAVLDADATLLARLVLDSVLEIEDGNEFVSGANASHLLEPDASATVGASGPARVSMDALRYAAELNIADAPTLSTRLYSYNREPISPSWTRRIADTSMVAHWLGLDYGAPLRSRLARSWIATPPRADNPGWIHFRRFECNSSRVKLYVCPRAELLPEALAEAVAAFEQHGLHAFKIGRDLHGVLRPDKLVAYAGSRERIDVCADALHRRMRGMLAQVAPFTAAIDNDGLLSWGVDPPREERVSNWQGSSWRRWITDRLAVALIAARAAGAPSPWQFALQRLAFDGIDVRSWAPAGVTWAQ